MAQGERKPKEQMSTVSSCGATSCGHNEDRECTAGQIRLEMRGNQAVCATYTPEKPKARP